MKKITELKKQLRLEVDRAFKEAKSKGDVVAVWKQDKRRKIPKQAKRMFCGGCRQNYYNGVGADECWNLEGAKLKERKIYPSLDSTKPEQVTTLNCFVKRYK